MKTPRPGPDCPWRIGGERGTRRFVPCDAVEIALVFAGDFDHPASVGGSAAAATPVFLLSHAVGGIAVTMNWRW